MINEIVDACNLSQFFSLLAALFVFSWNTCTLNCNFLSCPNGQRHVQSSIKENGTLFEVYLKLKMRTRKLHFRSFRPRITVVRQRPILFLYTTFTSFANIVTLTELLLCRSYLYTELVVDLHTIGILAQHPNQNLRAKHSNDVQGDITYLWFRLSVHSGLFVVP